jgi:hypothetical protein
MCGSSKRPNLLRGKAQLIRYADDFVMCFERRDDAERVLAVLSKRVEGFGLRLHPDKTRLVCSSVRLAATAGERP